METATLRPLFAPDSVAIIGASSTPGKYGHTVVRYLQKAGFKGRIYPINPEASEIAGLKAYRSVVDVPERIDCVFTVIPAIATAAAMRDCALAKVRAVIVGASGFAEMGNDAGRQRQTEIAEIARTAGIVLLGPNTNGIWNAHHGVALGFNTSHGGAMKAGPVSVAAHSGALFDSFIPRLAAFGCGFAKLVPLGNEPLLDMLDVLGALIDDEQTGVIGLVMEGLADGARFRTLAARARASSKPIVVLKLGRSAAGATAALAHSSRLAGSARAYDALLRDCGVPVVGSIETLAAVCTLLSDKRVLQMRGDTRLIGVSGSGGGCSLMADHAADRGIALAGADAGTWGGQTARLIASYDGVGLVRNPIDGGNLHGWDKLPELIDAMELDRHMGPVVGFSHRLPTLAGDVSFFAPLAARKQRTGSPVVIVSPGGLRPEMDERYLAEQIPVFSDMGTCFDSLRAIYSALEFAGDRDGEPQPGKLSPALIRDLRTTLEAAASRDFLSEIESAAVLRAAGVPMVESRIIHSSADAQQAGAEIGFPVVLKAIAPGVAHKNDAGLVAVGIDGVAAMTTAFDEIAARVARLGHGQGATTYLVQRQVRARAELILGTTYEPGLGHFLVVGLGGVYAELLDSVMLLPVPIGANALRDRFANSKLGVLVANLGRHCGRDLVSEVVATLDALHGLILAAADLIHSIDVNPLRIGEDGCVAVDALIVPRKSV